MLTQLDAGERRHKRPVYKGLGSQTLSVMLAQLTPSPVNNVASISTHWRISPCLRSFSISSSSAKADLE